MNPSLAATATREIETWVRFGNSGLKFVMKQRNVAVLSAATASPSVLLLHADLTGKRSDSGMVVAGSLTSH